MNGNETRGWLLVTVGFSCLIVANFISAYANIQLKRHATQQGKGHDQSRVTRSYLIMGVFLSIVAGVMDLLVIGSIPLAYRACSAPLSIPANVLVARWVLHEQIGQKRTLGIVLTFVGCMEGVLSMSRPSGSESSPSPTQLLPIIFFASIGVGAVLGEIFSLFKPHRVFSVLCAACGVAFIAGCSTTCGKLMSLFGRRDFISFQVLLFTIGCIGAAALQLTLLSRMLGRFEVSTCMPTYQIMTMIWLSLFSFFVFGEEVSNPVGFLAGFTTSGVGVWMVAESDPETKSETSPLMLDHRIHSIK